MSSVLHTCPEGANGIVGPGVLYERERRHPTERQLGAASTKLDEGKNADAVEKLVDFQSTLNALAPAPKPKVDPAVAQALIAEAQGVINCINAAAPPNKHKQ